MLAFFPLQLPLCLLPTAGLHFHMFSHDIKGGWAFLYSFFFSFSFFPSKIENIECRYPCTVLYKYLLWNKTNCMFGPHSWSRMAGKLCLRFWRGEGHQHQAPLLAMVCNTGLLQAATWTVQILAGNLYPRISVSEQVLLSVFHCHWNFSPLRLRPRSVLGVSW